MSRLDAFDLIKFAINANYLPVLDIPIRGAHDVIGTRAYAREKETVIALRREAAQGLIDRGVLPVMKHILGHGRAFSDTHFESAHVNGPLDILEKYDFMPFKNLVGLPAIITAHIAYEAIDGKVSATLSKKVIENVIRKKRGFDGLLILDDVSMKALSKFTFSEKFSDLICKIFATG
ncbi:glycoside hydrolase family 3 N-terminal domain-containing protein [Bartonella florencae]|uniref:glycoside hydrolase family 3 N-terminal domain-containing protein n=1 Tax=Bartonella florencae TaxID=928210 RepID=UPI00031C13F3|nr:glycoside hydrolase family 3 N-terminal domain-containing protein [Bartonella florencae]